MAAESLLVLALGVAIGMAIGWLLASSRVAATKAEAKAASDRTQQLETELGGVRSLLSSTEKELARVQVTAAEAHKRLDEQQRLLAATEQKFSDTFKALAADALRTNTEDFLKRADEKLKADHAASQLVFDARQKAIEDLVRPAGDSLVKLDAELRKIENERRGSQGELKAQLEALGSQTGKLVDALKTPVVRGRWGEVQLRNVVEIAGMKNRCDFFEQESRETDEGRLRPDMIVRLPGGKNVVVDSKAPLKAYLEALDATDEASRLLKLKEHATQVRTHFEQLSSKAYWDACKPTPEFVVLFLPGEVFFSAALQQDPTLMEDAWAKRVILATPTTLMAVLLSVAYTWRQEQLAENAAAISDLGQQLHDRLATMTGHLRKVGFALKGSVGAFNEAVGSLESRVLPVARKFKELGVASKLDVRELETVNQSPREIGESVETNGSDTDD